MSGEESVGNLSSIQFYEHRGFCKIERRNGNEYDTEKGKNKFRKYNKIKITLFKNDKTCSTKAWEP